MTQVFLYKPDRRKAFLIFLGFVAVATIIMAATRWNDSVITYAILILGWLYVPPLFRRSVRRIGINPSTNLVYFDTRRLFMPRVIEVPLALIEAEVETHKPRKGATTHKLVVRRGGDNFLTIYPGLSGWNLQVLKDFAAKVKELQGQYWEA